MPIRLPCKIHLILVAIAIMWPRQAAHAVASQGVQMPRIIYNAVRDDYFVAYSTLGPSNQMKAMILKLDGTQIPASAIDLDADEGAANFRMPPALAIDLEHERIFIVWGTWDGTTSNIKYAVVNARTYDLLVSATITSLAVPFDEVGVAYGPSIDQFLVVWPDGVGDIKGIYFDPEGAGQSAIFTLGTISSPAMGASTSWVQSPNADTTATGNFLILGRRGSGFFELSVGLLPGGSTSTPGVAYYGNTGISLETIPEPGTSFLWPIANDGSGDINIARVTPTSASPSGTSAPTVVSDAIAIPLAVSKFPNNDNFVMAHTTATDEITYSQYVVSNLSAGATDSVFNTTETLKAFDVATNSCGGGLVVATTENSSLINDFEISTIGNNCFPQISVSPMPLQLPDVPVGSSSSGTVLVTSDQFTASIDSVSMTDSTGPVIQSTTCNGIQLPAGQTCAINVKLSPQTTPGTYTATLNISHDGLVDPMPVSGNVIGNTSPPPLLKPTIPYLSTPPNHSTGIDPTNALLTWFQKEPFKGHYRTTVCSTGKVTACISTNSSFVTK